MAFSDFLLFAESVRFEDAQIALDAADLADGLPLIPPTEARLRAMLGDRDPNTSHGHMPPLFGDLTTATVAYNCVLAGCHPAEFPVVLAAAVATLAPEFNLLGILTTTGSAAVATLVHGPAVSMLGMNAGTNCLGPGNHANACIGRAMSLVLRNIGGARAGSGDMATVGQPGKYAFCFGESAPLWPPLHARRGAQTTSSAVTVLGLGGTVEVLPDEGRDLPEIILAPVARLMAASFASTGASRQPRKPEQVFILPPELAGQIAAAGWGLSHVRNHLYDASAALAGQPVSETPDEIHPIITGGPGIKMAYLPLWGGGTRMMTVPL
jgi:hypothetical protein